MIAPCLTPGYLLVSDIRHGITDLMRRGAGGRSIAIPLNQDERTALHEKPVMMR